MTDEPRYPRLHFLHISKTGGTAIKYALRQSGIPRRFGIKLHRHGVTLRDVPSGQGVIFFVRHPLNRFVSGFYSRKRQGLPRHPVPWSDEERLAFEQFDTPNHLAAALSCPDLAIRGQAEQAMRNILHVNAPLTMWLESVKYLRSRAADIQFVGFQESLADDFEQLKARLGLPLDIHLPSDDILAHRNPHDLPPDLDDRSKCNLMQWYRRDLRLLDCCRELSETLKAI